MAADVTLQLDIDNDLKFNANGAVGLNIKSEVDGRLTIKEDGIYVQAPDGSVTGGTIYEGSYDNEGLRVGSNCPFGRSDNPSVEQELMITCTDRVHKVFDAFDSEGKKLNNFRPDVDCTLPGDMYRVRVYDFDTDAGPGANDEEEPEEEPEETPGG